MKIIIGADPWAVELKVSLKKHLEEKGIEVIDVGSTIEEKRDYVDVATDVALAIQKNEVDRGIVLCGTGMGVAMVANKFKGVYAAVIESELSAFKCKQINNANVLAMGQMFISDFKAKLAIDNWLSIGHTEGLDPDLATFLQDSLIRLQRIEDQNFSS